MKEDSQENRTFLDNCKILNKENPNQKIRQKKKIYGNNM